MWIIGVALLALAYTSSNALAESIRGVNLGGWLLVEEW